MQVLGILLQSIVTAASISLVATFAYLFVAKTGLALARRGWRRSPFAGEILYEAGHRFREQLRSLDSTYSLYLTALVVFVIVFVTTGLVQSPSRAVNMPAWGWVLGALLVAVGACSLLLTLVRVMRTRSRIAYVTDAHIAIGHALQRTLAKGNRIFHNVDAGDAVIDHVVVGINGVYAVNVAVRGKRGWLQRKPDGKVTLENNELTFDDIKDTAVINDSMKKISALSRTLTKATGQPIKVRSVIAVPGWQIGSQTNEHHLLVNEKNLIMLTGWTSKEAYLMDEDVEKIYAYLARCCCEHT